MRQPFLAALGLSMAVAWVSLSAAAEAQPKRVIAFGDSITIGFREPGVDCNDPQGTAKGYPEHLEELLDAEGLEVSVDPFGVCGETTFEGITRIDQVLEESADAIIIMEGTNDISSGNPVISLESIVANLREMANKSVAANIEPVLASIIPYGPGVDGMQRNERAGRLADSLREVGNQDGRAYADVFNHLVDIPDLFSTYYFSDGFHLNAGGYELLAGAFPAAVEQAFDLRCVPEQCLPGDTAHCLGDGRFEVTAEWTTAQGSGVGTTIPFSDDTGQFWFFSPENIELVVKVLDGRCNNGHFWVFYGSLSNVEYRIRVTDTLTCERRIYFNPDGNFGSSADTSAFLGDTSACP